MKPESFEKQMQKKIYNLEIKSFECKNNVTEMSQFSD